MVVDDNRKRTDLQPRKELPDAWADKLRCPLCALPAIHLKVIHLPDSPDYLICPGCELSFEVEQHNGTIRLKNIPEQLSFAEIDLKHNWIQPTILRKLLDNRVNLMQEKSRSIAAQALTDDEVWNRMLGLYKLGNKPKMIEFMLVQAGATQEQAETAEQRLKQLAKQDEKNASRKMWLLGGLTILLIATLFMGTWFFTNQLINTQLSQGLGKSAHTSQPNQPLEILNKLPDAVKPDFLKGPPAYVEKIGPKTAGCPLRSQDATNLFGGVSGAWQRSSQPGSWQMITTGRPATIRIPKGMYAGFIDNKTFVFTSADGPATIHNVNFVVISCQ